MKINCSCSNLQKCCNKTEFVKVWKGEILNANINRAIQAILFPLKPLKLVDQAALQLNWCLILKLYTGSWSLKKNCKKYSGNFTIYGNTELLDHLKFNRYTYTD